MKWALLLLFFSSTVVCKAQSFTYPAAPAQPVVDTLFGKVVRDDYRWMHDVYTRSMRKWLEEQNRYTTEFLKKNTRLIEAHQEILRIASSKYEMSQKQGPYFFRLSRMEGSVTPALYYQKDLKQYPALLVNPRAISRSDVIDIRSFELSADHQYLAFQYNRNGSDWMEIRIVDMKTAKTRKEVLRDVKFSNIAWFKDGFYYCRWPRTKNSYDLSLGEEVYYHRVGTDQKADRLVYSRGKTSRTELSVQVTADEQFLLIQAKDEQVDEYGLYVRDHFKEDDSLRLLISGPPSYIKVLDSRAGKLIALSFYGNNNGHIVAIDPAHPQKWEALIPEMSDGVVMEARPFTKALVLVVQAELQELVLVYSWQGRLLKKIEFPDGYRAGAFSGAPADEEIYFSVNSFTEPPVIMRLNVETGAYRKRNALTDLNYNPGDFEYKKVYYPSLGGVQVPMLLIYKKGLQLNGSNPCLLEAYGGFGEVSRSVFNPGLVYFLEQGGVYAYAYIRGGGTKGNSWAVAGRGVNKQRSFGDFIAAAEYLTAMKYTSPSHLAATGTSNGGLVTGVAVTQRPDLFRAAVPMMGVFDMVYFEQATVGHFHLDEYGSINDSASFYRVMSYSPLHNVERSKHYPAFLIITGEQDDRVPPYQSYKLAATLQDLDGPAPVLLRTLPKVGHYGVQSWTGTIQLQAECYAFLLYCLKFNYKF